MATIRVTQGILVQRVLADLAAQNQRILDLQRQLSTGQRVNQPSDNPLAARRAIAALTDIGKTEQYLTNISTARPFFRQSEASLFTVVDAIQRANELALQGANNINAAPQGEALAREADQVLESVLQQANAFTNDRYLFSGTRTQTAPFEATRDANGRIVSVAYTGNLESNEIAVADGVTVATNVHGEEVFQRNVDLFETLIQLRDNLEAGNIAALQDRIGELHTAQDQTLLAASKLGAIENRLDRNAANLEELLIQFQELVSDNLDADFAEVIVQLNVTSNAYQAALNASARVLQPSLLDFIR